MIMICLASFADPAMDSASQQPISRTSSPADLPPLVPGKFACSRNDGEGIEGKVVSSVSGLGLKGQGKKGGDRRHELASFVSIR